MSKYSFEQLSKINTLLTSQWLLDSTQYQANIDARFLGEETYAKGQSRDYLIDENPTWCIDPLDGKSSISIHHQSTRFFQNDIADGHGALS